MMSQQPQVIVTVTPEGNVSVDTNITAELLQLGLLAKAIVMLAIPKAPVSPILKASQLPPGVG